MLFKNRKDYTLLKFRELTTEQAQQAAKSFPHMTDPWLCWFEVSGGRVVDVYHMSNAEIMAAQEVEVEERR